MIGFLSLVAALVVYAVVYRSGKKKYRRPWDKDSIIAEKAARIDAAATALFTIWAIRKMGKSSKDGLE
jgi:hypothetical protein